MDIIRKNKGIILGLIIFSVAFFGYNTFLKSDGAFVLETPSSSGTGAELLKISQDLKEATLSQELFSSPRFIMLVDFTATVPLTSVGRSNPFNLIGAD
ncbi:MAG: hypothetical protein WDZ64_01010 [Parcubacteria group bacterium]